MKIRYAKKNEKEIAIRHWKNSFKDTEEQINFYFENIFNHKNYLVLEKNKKIVSSLHENPYILNFNGIDVKTKYIVGVSTILEEQKKGFMSILIKEMLKISKENGYPFVFLTPINPDIYRRYGFEYFSKIENLKFNIENLAELKIDKDISFFEVSLNNKDTYLNDLIKIYSEYMKEKFCFLKRDEYYFNKLLMECFNDNMQVFISYKNNLPETYIIFSKYDDKIEIREIFSTKYENYKNPLSLLYSFKDYYKEVHLASAINSNIEYIFKNQLKIEKTVIPFMMMRILKPDVVLNFLDLKIKDLKIYIVDEIFKENTGIYIFNKKWLYSNTTDDYDLKININDLTLLLNGFFSFEEMLFMKKIDLKIDKKYEIKQFRDIFKRKETYLYEFQ